MKSSFNTMENDMTKQVILIGECKVGDGVIHQADFAAALNAERLTGWPKSMDDVQIAIGRLLANRKPAMLHRAEKNGVATVTVESLLTPEVTNKLVQLLEAKPRRETYEERALVSLLLLKATAATQPAQPDMAVVAKVIAEAFPKKRRGKKSKGVANG